MAAVILGLISVTNPLRACLRTYLTRAPKAGSQIDGQGPWSRRTVLGATFLMLCVCKE